MQHNRDGEVKLFNQFGLFSLLLTLTFTSVFAQDFADFKRVQSESFTKFKDKKDKEFNTYLQEQWKEYHAYMSPSMYQKQKPKVLPELSQKRVKNVGPHLIINIKPAVVKALIPPIKKLQAKDVIFSFFGSSLGFNIDKGMKNANFYPRSQQGIINFFSVMAASNYDDLLYNIKLTCKHMNLNDWGVYLLVNKLSHTLFTTPDDAKLFSWFLFNKLGFQVKVALGADEHIVLLYAIKGKMYSTPNYTLEGEKFYVVSKYNKANIGDIYTYTQNYPGATKSLDFELKTLPILKKNIQTKTVSFKEYGKVYSAMYHYNKNLIDFMNSYPQVDYKVFFNAPLEYETYKDIAGDIKHYTDNKKASEALNFVLRFVQKSFKYERDNEQFGREKVMFAEETLYYDKSDCEDRAVLYARLVKDLFDIGVVGVKYKDHMSTALYIPMRGDSIKVGRKRYVMADPTYVNANIGQEIPKYKNIQPDYFIYLNKNR